jgi:hypothetical protein
MAEMWTSAQKPTKFNILATFNVHIDPDLGHVGAGRRQFYACGDLKKFCVKIVE